MIIKKEDPDTKRAPPSLFPFPFRPTNTSDVVLFRRVATWLFLSPPPQISHPA